MEFANKPPLQTNPFRPNRTPTIRPAQLADKSTLWELIEGVTNLHIHADWQMPVDWIGAPGCLVYMEGTQLRGYIAATQDPGPVAWVRVLAIARFDPLPILKMLLPPVLEALKAAGAIQLSCLAVEQWVNEALPALGFEQTHHIQTLANKQLTLPALPPTSVTIQQVDHTFNDFVALAALDERAFSDPLWRHSAVQLQRGAQNSSCFTIATVAGRIVGFQYSTHQGKDYAHLVRISVDPHYHGQGIGSALLAHMLTYYAKMGIQNFSLNTQIDNDTSLGLYEKFGFRPINNPFNVWSHTLK